MDCMEGMKAFPDKFFDLAIVDPPYGIGLDFQFKSGLGDSIHKKKQWNKLPPPKEYFDELFRISKEQIIWGANYFPNIEAVGRIVHDKRMDNGRSKINFSEADIASCSLQKRITIFRYRWNGNRQGESVNWKNIGINARIHPTQKPVQLYQYCLKNYAKPDFKIIDTHVGSGSSIIAFIDFGCEWIGFEIDKDYHMAASERITIHQLQSKLF